MTSYSIEHVAPGMDDQEIWVSQCTTFVAGAARCLLDETRVVRPGTDRDQSEDEYASAEWWHTPRSGWELDAFDPESRRRFQDRVEWFFTRHVEQIRQVARCIEANDSGIWAQEGWSMYRAGILFTHSAIGNGLSFSDYARSDEERAAMRELDDATDRHLDGALRGLSATVCVDDDENASPVTIDEI